jgi:hypothetical protein
MIVLRDFEPCKRFLWAHNLSAVGFVDPGKTSSSIEIDKRIKIYSGHNSFAGKLEMNANAIIKLGTKRK